MNYIMEAMLEFQLWVSGTPLEGRSAGWTGRPMVVTWTLRSGDLVTPGGVGKSALAASLGSLPRLYPGALMSKNL